MINKKIIYLTLLSLIIFVLSLVNFLLPSRDIDNQSQSEFSGIPSISIPVYPTAYIPDIPDTEAIEISGVEVNNFYKDAITIGHIGDTLIVDEINYKITYFPLDEGFIISILDTDFETTKKKAEAKLLEILDTSEQKACELSVYIATPKTFNPDKAGKNWPLSFCE